MVLWVLLTYIHECYDSTDRRVSGCVAVCSIKACEVRQFLENLSFIG